MLFRSDTLASLAVPAATAQLMVMAVGIGDGDTPPVETLTNPGQAVMPIAPVHLRSERLGGGDVRFNWIRRSCDGWRWVDTVDAPLAEEQERYRVVVTPNGGSPRSVETVTTSYVYDAAAQAADAATSVTISVVQLGTFGPSRATALTLTLT